MQTPCIPFTGAIGAYGYGWLWLVSGKRRQQAHRHAWEQVYGPIAAGLVLDHLCHNEAAQRGECQGGRSCLHRRCVNVAHLALTTSGDNVRRSGLSGSHQTVKTHCPNNHPYDSENTIIRYGARYCRECHRIDGRRRSRLRRTAA